MAYVMKQVSSRSQTIPLILAIVLALGLLSLYARTLPVLAQKANTDGTAVMRNWFDQRNQGDDRAASQMFADTTYFVAAPPAKACTMQAPCHDPESAWWSLQAAETGANYCVTVTSIQADDGKVTGRYEERNDTICSRGIERIVAAITSEAKTGKIVSFLQWRDETDAMAIFSAVIAAGTAQAGTPIVTPNPVCS